MLHTVISGMTVQRSYFFALEYNCNPVGKTQIQSFSEDTAMIDFYNIVQHLIKKHNLNLLVLAQKRIRNTISTYIDKNFTSFYLSKNINKTYFLILELKNIWSAYADDYNEIINKSKNRRIKGAIKIYLLCKKQGLLSEVELKNNRWPNSVRKRRVLLNICFK